MVTSSLDGTNCNDDQTSGDPCTSTSTMDAQCSNNGLLLFWIGTSNLAVSSTFQGMVINWALAIFCIACSVVSCVIWKFANIYLDDYFFYLPFFVIVWQAVTSI